MGHIENEFVIALCLYSRFYIIKDNAPNIWMNVQNNKLYET